MRKGVSERIETLVERDQRIMAQVDENSEDIIGLRGRIIQLENDLAECQAVATELAQENEVLKGKLHDNTAIRSASTGRASKEQATGN